MTMTTPRPLVALPAAAPFAAFATELGPRLGGRAARLACIRSFNNVADVELVHVPASCGGRVDGYRFRGTNATARGVARETGLNVYWLGADLFLAANL